MVEKGIQELCSLYTEMKKRFRAIKLDFLDEENALAIRMKYGSTIYNNRREERQAIDAP